jgi:predicted transcriptional regulator
MKFSDEATLPLPLLGGVVQAQRLVVPPEVIRGLPTYRHACRLAWKLRRTRMSQKTFAALAGLYPPHVSDYLSVHATRRELPARCVAAVEAVLGNAVIGQWLAAQSQLTVLEELQVQRRALGRAA